jgi:hypothetical protein
MAEISKQENPLFNPQNAYIIGGGTCALSICKASEKS